MAMATSSGAGNSFQLGRDQLDAPPPRGRIRNDPSEPRSLSRGSQLAALARENSPEGEMAEPELDGASELDMHPVVQAFDTYQQARGYLQQLGTHMPAVLTLVTDFITTLDQMVPQAGAAMLSGGALGMGAGLSPAGAPMGQPAAGGPPMMGLQQLAGMGAGMAGGAGAGMPMGPMTPGMGMGAGM